MFLCQNPLYGGVGSKMHSPNCDSARAHAFDLHFFLETIYAKIPSQTNHE